MAEWAPTLEDVGSRIPTRTRDQTTPGNDAVTGTFNDVTVPTADQVEPLIDEAVATVTVAVTTIAPAQYDLAKSAAAWRAAADIELAWPERDADIREVYDRLAARAAHALDRLVQASQDAGGGPDATVPTWSMPDPVPWGDDYL